MRHQPAWLALLIISALALWLLPEQEGTQAQPGQRCFAETSFCIAGRIRAFWEQNGGLRVFGFPTTPPAHGTGREPVA